MEGRHARYVRVQPTQLHGFLRHEGDTGGGEGASKPHPTPFLRIDACSSLLRIGHQQLLVWSAGVAHSPWSPVENRTDGDGHHAEGSRKTDPPIV